jgi:hypothetical protein
VTDMNHSGGIIAMMVSRFEGEQLEPLLELKRAVDQGACLNEHHGDLLEQICGEAILSKRLVDRHPEYHALYARSARLFKEITARALENEIQAQSGVAAMGSARLN